MHDMPKVEKIGRVSNASVLKCTGKTWDQWISILEKAGGRGLTHGEIVAILKKKYKLTVWWQQGVTTGFEMHIGRKLEGRNAKGEYSTVATKTLPISQSALWRYLESHEGQGVWLEPMADFRFGAGEQFEVAGGVFGEIRTLKKPERLRLRWNNEDWPKPSVLNIAVIPRPADKCVLVFQHDHLPSERAKTTMNGHWKKILAALKERLG